ncbi:hypothetical protein [Chloracidobacterium thermophilum]|uniref:hypothetical protein n=1 Tax=Chloracidobacterium thermophilum TaxID=458033 RepID=UPI001BB2ED93|nr:hypothetical protein [Chloracidobacterium thermophilum]QUV80022.1 hypothetical protein J8C08_14765 [Chloracidobacterium thermophilum]
MTTASLQALLSRLIDYAGLFPPAALDLANAVENYRRFRTSADAWMLGAFVLPAGQVSAFQSATQMAASPDDPPFRWPVSLLVEATDLPRTDCMWWRSKPKPTIRPWYGGSWNAGPQLRSSSN